MFKKIFIAFTLFHLLRISPASAVDNHPESSAGLKPTEVIEEKKGSRQVKLSSYLSRFNSPLVDHIEFIVQVADAYDIPYTYLPAIAGVESTYCRHIPPNSFNCWGWNNGDFRFTDYEDAIFTITKALRYSYFERGLNNPYSISRIYAPPSDAWGGKVDKITREIDNPEIPELLQLSI